MPCRCDQVACGRVGRDALVIEVVVKFVVEPLDILERRNDLLQVVILES
jgi:hypothetical protein